MTERNFFKNWILQLTGSDSEPGLLDQFYRNCHPNCTDVLTHDRHMRWFFLIFYLQFALLKKLFSAETNKRLTDLFKNHSHDEDIVAKRSLSRELIDILEAVSAPINISDLSPAPPETALQSLVSGLLQIEQNQSRLLTHLNLRTIGSLFEALLDYQPDSGKNPKQKLAGRRRKKTGSYYTPLPIIRNIIQASVGRRVDHLIATANEYGELRERLLNIRILDPAMGCGFFLLEALNHLATQCADHPGEKPHTPNHFRQEIVRNCLYGIDKNPLAVDMARLALWMHSGADPQSARELMDHLRVDNSLTQTMKPQFDIVIGNPPYGRILDRDELHHIQTVYPAPWKRLTQNIAMPFIYQGWQALKEGGFMALIVPKALTYVASWQAVRSFLTSETALLELTDNGQSFGEVLLEMVTFCSAKGRQSTQKDIDSRQLYVGKYARFSGSERYSLKRKYCHPRTFLVSINQAGQEALYEGIQAKSVPLGQVCDIYRGLSINNRLRENTYPSRDQPILRGRHLNPWKICGQSYVSATDLNSFHPGELVLQEIVAHVYTPVPHIKLIGALNPQGLPSVNTVTNLRLREPSKFKPGFILAALQSRIINWYIYKFIFVNAFRTMHFSGHYAEQAPLPDMPAEMIERIDRLALDITDNRIETAAGKQKIDALFMAFFEDKQLSVDRIVEIIDVY